MTVNPFIPVYLMRNSAKGVPSRWHEDALSDGRLMRIGAVTGSYKRSRTCVLQIKQVRISALIYIYSRLA